MLVSKKPFCWIEYIFNYFFRKTVRAAIVLFVFLGFTHVVFLYNPKDGGTGEICYLLVNAISQGGQVSISYTVFRIE